MKNVIILTLPKQRNPLYKDLIVAGKRCIPSKKLYNRNKSKRLSNSES